MTLSLSKLALHYSWEKVRKLDFSFTSWITETRPDLLLMSFHDLIESDIDILLNKGFLSDRQRIIITRHSLSCSTLSTVHSLILHLSQCDKTLSARPNWRKRREAKIPKSQLSEAQNFCWNFVSDFIIRFVFCLPQNIEEQ